MPRSRKRVQPVPGQVQGQRKAQEDALAQVGGAARSTAPPLSEVVPLGAPSQRPDEPITAGLPTGPGPGPEALGPVGLPPGDALDVELRSLYAANPNPDLLELIEFTQRRVTPPEARL